MQEMKNAPRERGAGGVKCWKGEPGLEGWRDPAMPVKTNPEFFEDLDEVIQGIEESMRQEIPGTMPGEEKIRTHKKGNRYGNDTEADAFGAGGGEGDRDQLREDVSAGEDRRVSHHPGGEAAAGIQQGTGQLAGKAG